MNVLLLGPLANMLSSTAASSRTTTAAATPITRLTQSLTPDLMALGVASCVGARSWTWATLTRGDAAPRETARWSHSLRTELSTVCSSADVHGPSRLTRFARCRISRNCSEALRCRKLPRTLTRPSCAGPHDSPGPSPNARDYKRHATRPRKARPALDPLRLVAHAPRCHTTCWYAIYSIARRGSLTISSR